MFKTIALLAALALGTVGAAKADSISIIGSDTYNSTAITFTGPGSVLGTPTGIFAGFASPCFGCVTMASTLTYAGSPFVPTVLYTINDGGNTASLTLNSITAVIDNLEIIGDATIVVNGQTYYGTLDLTTQRGGAGNVTFSATTSTVPEPASLALFGTGLLGIVGIARRKFNV